MRRGGPWLVGLGAGLWGTESLFRQPLGGILHEYAIVFWEHALMALLFLPVLIVMRRELGRLSARAWFFLLVSGAAGSAIGTVCYQAAIDHGNATVVSVVISIQPLFSTIGAVVVLGDRLARRFVPWATLAIVAGLLLSVDRPQAIFTSLHTGAFQPGTGWALLCALFWGLATVAGRGVMVEVPLALASALRIFVGLACMTVIISVSRHPLVPEAARHAKPVLEMIGLVTISGAIPLVVYFAGLRHTHASTAGYLEMVQTVVAAGVGWAFLHGALTAVQVVAAVVLMVCVVMVKRAQEGAQPL